MRFVCNGWHTCRRYQRRDVKCLFCDNSEAEDSIEHFVHCDRVQDSFLDALKKGETLKVPTPSFFLMGLDGKQRIAMALVIFALCTVICVEHHACRMCLLRA